MIVGLYTIVVDVLLFNSFISLTTVHYKPVNNAIGEALRTNEDYLLLCVLWCCGGVFSFKHYHDSY